VTPVTLGVATLVALEVELTAPVPLTAALVEPVDELDDEAANAADERAVRPSKTKYLVRLFMIS
jgi:hypothetical protein